jgi:hypothetical protein
VCFEDVYLNITYQKHGTINLLKLFKVDSAAARLYMYYPFCNSVVTQVRSLPRSLVYDELAVGVQRVACHHGRQTSESKRTRLRKLRGIDSVMQNPSKQNIYILFRY